MRSIRCLLLLAALGPVGAAAQPVRNGALPPLFPSDNWWNVDVSQAPVDGKSAAFLDFLGRTRGMHPDFGGDSSPAPEIYGMVYASVPGDQPLEPVAFDYADESDPGAPGRPAGYPIPQEAKTQPRWIEGGYPGNVGVSGDRHLLVVDRDRRLLFEMFNSRCVPEGSASCSWQAGSGAVFSLDDNGRRPDGWTSADAAGLAILPGLVRYDEAAGSAPIRHAFRVTVRATDGYVFPASHRAGSTSGALPMGARLRLRGDKDLSGYPPLLQRIFQAMKSYGLIVADNGSDLYVQGTYDTRWDNDVLNPAFASLKGSDFEVIQLGWKPSGTTPGCTADSTAGCTRWLLPSSAHLAGAGGAFYTTDLAVANTGTADATFFLKFLGNGVDGRGGVEKAFALGAGKAVTYGDVVASAFGIASGYGAIQLRSASTALVAVSQTSTPGPDGGTFGQAVPVFAEADLVRPGTPRSILGVREDGAFRTNVILANATEAPLDVDVQLFAQSAELLGGKRYSLPPLGMVQVTRVVRDLGIASDVAGARLVLSTPTAGGALAAYAAAIDGVTNDPRTLLPR